jgi:hypothetical protein
MWSPLGLVLPTPARCWARVRPQRRPSRLSVARVLVRASSPSALAPMSVRQVATHRKMTVVLQTC